MGQKILPPLEHWHQRRRIEPGQQDVVAAPRGRADRCRNTPQLAGFTKRIAEHDVACRARSAGRLRPRLAKLDELKAACGGDRVHVGASVDHCALPGEDAAPGGRRDDRPDHAIGAVDRNRGVERVDRRDNIDRGVERSSLVGVVGAPRRVGLAPAILFRHGQVDFGQAQSREARDDPRRDPLAARIDDLRIARDDGVGPGGDDPAIAHYHGRADHRLRAVAKRHRPAGDRDTLPSKRRRSGKQCGGDQEALHFVSPSPGWPSSKSLTGRFFGSPESYISAPSIHTRSGRV